MFSCIQRAFLITFAFIIFPNTCGGVTPETMAILASCSSILIIFLEIIQKALSLLAFKIKITLQPERTSVSIYSEFPQSNPLTSLISDRGQRPTESQGNEADSLFTRVQLLGSVFSVTPFQRLILQTEWQTSALLYFIPFRLRASKQAEARQDALYRTPHRQCCRRMLDHILILVKKNHIHSEHFNKTVS